jgi:hypothetical protein
VSEVEGKWSEVYVIAKVNVRRYGCWIRGSNRRKMLSTWMWIDPLKVGPSRIADQGLHCTIPSLRRRMRKVSEKSGSGSGSEDGYEDKSLISTSERRILPSLKVCSRYPCCLSPTR